MGFFQGPLTFHGSGLMVSQIQSETRAAEQEPTLRDPSRFALDEEGDSLLYSACAGDVEPQLFLYQ